MDQSILFKHLVYQGKNPVWMQELVVQIDIS